MSTDFIEIFPEQIWRKSFPVSFFGLSLNTHMTVIRLSNNQLCLHSPVPLTEHEKAFLENKGEIACIIAPNLFHHLFLNDCGKHFPNASVYAPEKLKQKIKPLIAYRPLGSEEFPGLKSIKVDGIPLIDEFVFYHEETQTLILTDLLFALHHPTNIFRKLLYKIMGIHKPIAMSRLMKRLIKDKDAFNKFTKQLENLDIRICCVAHERIIQQDAKIQLLKALRES